MSERPLVCMSSTVASSDSQALDTWLAPMQSTPRAEATLATFLVETPPATISGAAATTARSIREWRTSRQSGK